MQHHKTLKKTHCCFSVVFSQIILMHYQCVKLTDIR